MLSKLNIAGQNGQFRTPRHIIRMMVQMCDPLLKSLEHDPRYAAFLKKMRLPA